LTDLPLHNSDLAVQLLRKRAADSKDCVLSSARSASSPCPIFAREHLARPREGEAWMLQFACSKQSRLGVVLFCQIGRERDERRRENDA
jgi:hypothetical protein